MRIAVVGTGSIGRRHIENLLALGYRDIIAVSEFSQASTVTIAGTEISATYRFEDALHQDIDCIFICNPTIYHSSYLFQSVMARKHVFLEKPVSISASDKDLSKAIEVLNTHKVIVAVGHQFRFNPHLLEIKETLDDDSLGVIYRVEAVQGEHLADYHPGETYQKSYAANSSLGGGVLLTQIHQMDYLSWLFGPFDSVCAFERKQKILQLDVEENVSYLLKSSRGVLVYGHVDYLQRPKQLALTVFGENGRLNWNYYRNSLVETQTNTQVIEHSCAEEFKRNDMFIAELRDFFEAIQVGRSPRSDLTTGQYAVRIVDSIKESIKYGRVVELTT